MSRKSTMILLLLSLPLVGSLVEQVCINIANAEISISTWNVSNVTIHDGRSAMNCAVNNWSCIFQCTFSNRSWFNETSHCSEANINYYKADKIVYTMKHCTCTLNYCLEENILPLINSLDHSSSHLDEMMELFYIRDFCTELFSSNHHMKKSFITVEKQIIHNLMDSSQLETRGSITYNMKVVSLNVVSFTGANLNSSINSSIQIQVPQLLPQNTSFVPDTWLPVNALQSIPEDRRIVGLVSYMQHSQFQFQHENISSMVIRIEVLQERLHDLNTSIKMIFTNVTHRAMDNHSSLQCRFFDEQDNQWKTDGCVTESDDTQGDIICSCNHATAFAVLLMREPIAQLHWEILSHISYIGCGLSAFFTALSIVIYIYSRNGRMDYSISIHVSLSGALFLLNSTFLLTEWGATVKLDWVCVLVAALMHYSLLCCFTWMAIEALHLYLLLIKVFNTFYRHYLVKLSLAGWGIPGVIVVISLGVKDLKQFYGLTQMTMSDTNQTNSICWITDDTFFYALNLVYFTLIFIFNSGILIAVASSICSMKQVFRNNSKVGKLGRTEKFAESCKSALTVLGLTCLMGTTWGLAFLGSGYVNYPILYLFCILNSTQGFFIFLWICLSVSRQRKKDMEDRMSSSPVKTSGTKSE